MRVTIVQGAFLPVPPVKGGAVEKLWFALGKQLAERGLQVTHISKRHDDQRFDEVEEGVRRIRVKGFAWSNFKILSRVFDFLYSLRVLKVLPAADILVTNTFFLPLLTDSSKTGRIYVSVHRFPRKQFSLYNKAVRFQCVSNVVANELVRLNPGCAKRTLVIPNFVENVVSADVAVSSFSVREKKVLFVGRVHPEKGIQLLINGFALLPECLRREWMLEVVGPHEAASGGGGEVFFEELKVLALKNEVQVQWTGPVFDDGKLAEIYASAKVFVYPSVAAQGEALPLSPLEAMAQGTPVLVSNLDCFKDYILENRNGWVFDVFGKKPEKSLSDKLIQAFADVDVGGEDFVKCAVSTARDFSLDSVVDKFISDFKEIVRGE